MLVLMMKQYIHNAGVSTFILLLTCQTIIKPEDYSQNKRQSHERLQKLFWNDAFVNWDKLKPITYNDHSIRELCANYTLQAQSKIVCIIIGGTSNDLTNEPMNHITRSSLSKYLWLIHHPTKKILSFMRENIWL